MNAQDRPDFAEALVRLFAAFGKHPEPEQVDAYWHYLADQPLMTVLDGIESAGRKAGRYLPSVGQIRECIDATTIAHTPRDTRHTGDIKCEACDDTGWQPCTDHAGNRAVRPCHCVCGSTKGRNRLAGVA